MNGCMYLQMYACMRVGLQRVAKCRGDPHQTGIGDPPSTCRSDQAEL